ncbi:MAG: 2-C-methyl-D-erythritol 2,4-cyclodiphosphate synthase [bacterium]
MRIGFGYDVHRLVKNRPLILGGLTIPHNKGLLGHSDADVLLHAIADALLGAAAVGDIGTHFPDHDPSFRDISSVRLLEKVVEILEKEGYDIGNVDTTLVMEAPRISDHIPRMRKNIATALSVEVRSISVKATTTEGLGYIGSGEGIAAYAYVLIRKRA